MPRFQVVMTVNSTSPIASGNAPPCGVLGRFAPNKVRSMTRNPAQSALAASQP